VNRKTRSILQEISQHVPTKDKDVIIETRSTHIIESAVNLFETMRSHYSEEIFEDLARKFLLSIKQNDPQKFTRALERAKKK
jgi:hypothetical protein